MIEFNSDIQIEGVNGKGEQAIEALNKLIQARSDALNQTVFHATAATAVTTLKSIRALTLDAKNTKKFNTKVEKMPYFVGFSYKDRKMVIRTGMDGHSSRVDGQRVVFLTQGIKNPTKNAQVFKVTYEKENIKPFLIACASQSVAEAYALKATQKRIESRGTLGKNALGVAIGKIAAKSLNLEGSSISKILASQVADVNETRQDNEYTLSITDHLSYASDALKGGEQAIEMALQAAANKVYGTVAHLAGKDFTEQFPSKPFPDL